MNVSIKANNISIKSKSNFIVFIETISAKAKAIKAITSNFKTFLAYNSIIIFKSTTK